MSSSRANDTAAAEASPSASEPPQSPRNPPRLDTSSRARPKFVSFGRDSELGGPPNREFINEHTPLMMPPRGGDRDPLLKEPLSPIGTEDDWDNEPETEETKSALFLFLLTLGGLGLQIGWSVETSNGSVCRSPLTFTSSLY
jgi:solute carrier family 45 protein 1/2/4